MTESTSQLRFSQSALDAIAARDNPALIVTVDTEEEGLWGDEFKSHDVTVDNIREVRRFQSLCERFEVRPTYLVDTPVVEQDVSFGVLNDIFQEGMCEIGAHLHPWCAPPFDEELSPHNSYMCNLPESLQKEKLSRLTDLIESRFGNRPTSFRAGRYGLDSTGARLLRELGYIVDSSVLPFTNPSKQGGPDFRSAPFSPYPVSSNQLCTASETSDLLEVPVTVGYNRANFIRCQRILKRLGTPPWKQLSLIGLLDEVGMIRRIKMSPELHDGPELASLVKSYRRNHVPCIVIMLHSSSLCIGTSPYSKDAQQLEKLYQSLESAIRCCIEEHGMHPSTLTEFAEKIAHEDGAPTTCETVA